MREPLSRQAQRAIRRYIIEHDLKSGDPLPSEAQLGEALDMGKTSIREGLRSLETVGVVRVVHGRGLYVGEFSFAPLIDQLPYGLVAGGAPIAELLQVRRALEVGLITEVARVLSEPDLAALDEIVAQMANAGPNAVPPEVDRRFHRLLFAPLGNGLLAELIDVFWQIYERLQPDRHPDAASTAGDHAAIVAAIRAGDEGAMARAMADHFRDIEHDLEDPHARHHSGAHLLV